jgi:hypothetical protein
LVTPAAGHPLKGCIEEYGDNINFGKVVLNREGNRVNFTADFVDSIRGLNWKTEYEKLVKKYSPTYVFEGGADNIIGDERFDLRNVAFTKYFILDGAKRNLSGKYLDDFFTKLDPLLML